MAALTADRNTPRQGAGQLVSYPVAASTTLYAGGLVALNAAGYAVPAADTEGLIVVGVAEKKVNNASGAAGDLSVNVWVDAIFELAASAITQAMVGDAMYVVDDQTFDDANPGNGIVAGQLVEFVSSTKGRVYIPPAKQVIGYLKGKATLNPSSLIDAAGETLTITVTGAKLGDFALVSAPYDLSGISVTAYVSAADTVAVRIQNESGGTLDLASGVWRALVIPQ